MMRAKTMREGAGGTGSAMMLIGSACLAASTSATHGLATYLLVGASGITILIGLALKWPQVRAMYGIAKIGED